MQNEGMKLYVQLLSDTPSATPGPERSLAVTERQLRGDGSAR